MPQRTQVGLADMIIKYSIFDLFFKLRLCFLSQTTAQIVVFYARMCSEQTAGRQGESGSSSGELLSTGGGEPVPVHQEHLTLPSSLLLSSFFIALKLTYRIFFSLSLTTEM